jgi:hypothetical protein
VPRQQIADTSCRMVADAGEDIGNIGLRVEAIQFCGFDQRVEGSRASAAGTGQAQDAEGGPASG